MLRISWIGQDILPFLGEAISIVLVQLLLLSKKFNKTYPPVYLSYVLNNILYQEIFYEKKTFTDRVNGRISYYCATYS